MYSLRLQHAATLIDREYLSNHVPPRPESTRPSNSIHSISRHIDELQSSIAAARSTFSQLRFSLDRRRSSLSSLKSSPSPGPSVPSLQKSINARQHDAALQHATISASRIFLCREAASLYGLRQRRRRRGGSTREDYSIGGIGIVDLRDLNSTAFPRFCFSADPPDASPAQITTSLTHLAHLLVLTSHYLSLQLPAEVTLPHRDYPLPTIFTPAASYSSRQVPFPGSTPSHSSSNSPSASRAADFKPFPRPRPLYLDKPLPALSKEDPATYSLFIEGVTLLAWDIAWVCRTQGLYVASNSWEEVCPLGRNLWQLLCAPPASQEESTTVSAGSSPAKARAPPLLLGHYSHGAAHAFLGAAEGVEHIRGWKMRSATQVADKVKALLLSEMAGAEWEVLEEREWGEAEVDAPAEGVGGPEVAAADEPGGGAGGPSDTPRGAADKGGTSGWTKLKPR